MSTSLQNAELLTYDLTNLIRTYDDDAVADATALANRVLSKANSELDHATHKFSKELFITTTLYVAFNEQKPSLLHVLDCIVDPKWETEKKMLERITSISNHTSRRQNVVAWLRAFKDNSSCLSTGTAQRTVMRCHDQWCNAFNLPRPATSRNTLHNQKDKNMLPTPDATPLDCIRIGTRHELSDATSLATKIMRRVRAETDEATYTLAHELFTAVVLMTAHTIRCANLSNVLECLVDPNWDSHRQMYLYIGQCTELANSRQTKTKIWIGEWKERMLAMPHNALESLSKRSHALWQKACLVQVSVADENAVENILPSIPTNAIQVFNMADVSKAMTMVGDLRDDKRGGGERLLKSAQQNNGCRTIPDVKKAGYYLKMRKGSLKT